MVVFDVHILEVGSWALALLGALVVVNLQYNDKREPIWLGFKMRAFQFVFTFLAPLVATLVAAVGLAYTVTKVNPFVRHFVRLCFASNQEIDTLRSSQLAVCDSFCFGPIRLPSFAFKDRVSPSTHFSTSDSRRQYRARPL